MSALNLNSEYLAAWLALSATAAVLIAWQYKGNPEKTRGWLGASAICLELLAAALAVLWALNNAEGAFKAFFVAGVIGLAVAKATLLPGVVKAIRQRDYAATMVGGMSAIGAYLTVYLLGAMSGLEHDTERTASAVAHSAPLQAIETEITVARERLKNLSPFSDTEKAYADELAASSAMRAYQKQKAQLQTSLATAQAQLEGCPANHKTRCIIPANQEIARIESQLSTLIQPVRESNYSLRHDEYLEAQQQLVKLEQQRAEMLSSGASAGMVAGSDDMLLSWLTGFSDNKARALKWLLLVAVFDLMSGAIRLFSEMMHGGDRCRNALSRYASLIDAGLSEIEAASILSGGIATSPPAGVIPSLNTGGLITRDGLAFLHTGERVLNLDETAKFEAFLKKEGAPSAKSKEFIEKQGAPTESQEFIDKQGAAIVTEKVVFRDRERVPDHLSQRAGRGRVGKVDTCRDCGVDFVIESYNATRCKACAAKAEESCRKTKKRLAA